MIVPRRVLWIVLLLVASCSVNARQKAILATYTTVNAARDGFLAFSKKHEADLVAKATTRGDAKKAVAAYRAKADPIAKAIEDVYRAIAAAAVINADPKSLDNMIQAAAILTPLLDDFLKGQGQ